MILPLRQAISLVLMTGIMVPSLMAAAPDVKYLYPAGAARGTTVEIMAGGDVGGWPAQAWVNRSGVTVTPASDKGKFSVAGAADAAPGVYWVRIYNAEGAAAPLPFLVGTLPEVTEQEPNDSPAKPQAMPSSTCVVNGRLEKRGDVDTFAVSLLRGQTLVAAVTAHETLRSPMDAVLQVVSPRGSVLAQSDDERGLDPLLPFTAPAHGGYLVRIFAFPAAPDASISFAGGDTFMYRLILTTGGFVDGALPLAVSRGQPATVEACGWNLVAADKQRVVEAPAEQWAVELFDPQWANNLLLPVVDHRSLVEAEPNDASQPQPIDVPATVSGRIGGARDHDAFRVHLTKGQPWQFKLESHSLGYPLDGVLELFDASGKSLARADDSGKNPDAELKYTAATDGDYTLKVTDLFEHGGPRYFYCLTIAPLVPDFALSISQHAFVLDVGKPLEIPVSIERRQNFAGEIDIQIVGLPESVTASPVKSATEGESAKMVKLVLTATAAPFAGPIRIVGAGMAQATVSRTAEASLPGRDERTTDLWLTVK